MQWQDIVISLCQFGFVISLVPSILSDHKPPVSTSLMTFVLVSTIVICLATLGLWLSVVSGGLSALAWLILAIQKYKPKKVRA